MATYISYIDPNDIKKISIYVDNFRHSAASLRKYLGCDYVINGGLFKWSTGKSVQKLKVDGVIRSTDQWGYVAPTWNGPADFAFRRIDSGFNVSEKNAITCSTLKFNGTVSWVAINGAQNDPALGYAARRTCIGMKDGKIALFLSTTGYRPKALYEYLEKQGWDSILMLDGGGSTQGYIGPGKAVTSSDGRTVHNFICIWLKKDTEGGDNSSVTPPPDGGYEWGKNPYPVPKRALQYGMTGNDVRWMQYQLNVHSVKTDVDGSFGPAARNSVRVFQFKHKLTVDGSCGPATQNALKQRPGSVPPPSGNPYPEPKRALQYRMTGSDVKWMQYQLNEKGYKVAIDGSFGPASLNAVKQFQGDNSLAVDGSCGPATQAALKR